MKDNPYMLVGALLVMLLVMIGVAWYFGGSQSTPISSTQATKTFRAKAGTQRDAAKALVSDRNHDQSKLGTSAKPVEVWGRLGGGESGGEGDSPAKNAELLAVEVLRDLTPEEGIAVLTAELQRSEAPSAIYAALATLYARQSPYDETRVEDAFALALSTAATAEERLNAVYHQAKVYLERGEPEAMLELLERTKPETAEFSARLAEIEVMRANALMSAGDSPAAIAALEAIVLREGTESLLEDETYEGVYRQAALRLVRFYKDIGDTTSAESLGRTLKAQLRD